MSGRMPSFILVGVFIIMFLLAVFYTSCSSKNSELRGSLEQFEERVRSLTIKNSDAEKKIESLNIRKRELEEEKQTIHRQLEKKDSEINDLNTRINEKLAEIRTLTSDKDVLKNQLKECQILSETIANKNSLIEKLQKEINQEKEFHANERIRLQNEVDNLKVRRSLDNQTSNNQQQNGIQPSQRFAPLISLNITEGPISALFQGSNQHQNDAAREVKPNIVPAGIENGAGLNNFVPNQLENVAGQQLNQNVLPNPGVHNGQAQSNRNHIESAQVPPGAGIQQKLDNRNDNSNLFGQGERLNNEAANKNSPDIVNDDDNDNDDDMDNDIRLDKNLQLKKRDVGEANPSVKVDQGISTLQPNPGNGSDTNLLNSEVTNNTGGVLYKQFVAALKQDTHITEAPTKNDGTNQYINLKQN